LKAKSTITFNVPQMPAALSALEAAIDSALNNAWGIHEHSRTFTLTWASFSGHSTVKENAVTRLLEYYREAGGWGVDWTTNGTVSMSATFTR